MILYIYTCIHTYMCAWVPDWFICYVYPFCLAEWDLALPERGNLKVFKRQEDTPEVYGHNREFHTVWTYTIYLFQEK